METTETAAAVSATFFERRALRDRMSVLPFRF
jgi:hypothetical protein